MRNVIFCLVGIFLVLGLAEAASFEVKKNSTFVDSPYLEGDVVSGVLNISFDEQENIYFTNSLDRGKAMVLDILNKSNFSRGRDFTCEPVSCESYYIAHTLMTNQIISLDPEDEDLFGFKIEEKNKLIRSIDSLKFKVEVSGIDVSPENQIYIDLFNDGANDYYNQNVCTGPCSFEWYYGRNQGCFNEEEVTRRVPVGEELYCEYMEDIPPSNSYEIGANLNLTKPGADLGFYLYPADGGFETLGWVGLKDISTIGENTFGTVVNYSSLEKFDALVCVRSTTEGYFYIKTNEEDEERCGLVFEAGEEVTEDDFEIDYDIFINPKGFGDIITAEFDKEVYKDITDRDLKDDLTDYLNRTYAMNCSGEDGCVIPFSVRGLPPADGTDSTQFIYDVELGYKYGQGTSEKLEKVYAVTERPAKISSKWLKILLENFDIEVPDKTGRYLFKLFLEEDEVMSKEIRVDIGWGFSLVPRFAYIGRETYFIAKGADNVVSSVWDFDDGSLPVSVQGTNVVHTFQEPGEYKVKVTLIRQASAGSSAKNSTKRFNIIVGEAKESASLTLKDYEAKIASLQAALNNYSTWVKPTLSEALALETKKAVIQTKRGEFDKLTQTSPDSDYIKIIDDLLAVDLPDSLYTSTTTGLLPGDLSYPDADMAHLLAVSDSEAEDLEDLKARVYAWMNEHYDFSLSFETISAKNDEQQIKILNKYKIKITEKKDPGDESYLIIGYPQAGIVFASPGETFLETSTGGIYTNLVVNPVTELEFLIAGTNAPTAMKLGAYISPSPESLGVDDRPIKKCWLENCDGEGNFLWGRFLIGLGAIALFFLVVYLLLQSWYKKSYEKHLFPNSNDLYNLLNFIYNSRRNGLRDSDTKASLRNRKWSGEQIKYAFNKLEGKRTGMWEIPLFKFVENNKVRREIQRQQGGQPIDTRFIKRPNL